jgi:glycosyltransferase involved in cell wall biosynthesis
MKVVLLALDANEARARTHLEKTFPGASIEAIPRASIGSGSLIAAIKLARRMHPEVFAVSMENLKSQRGQNLLSLFSVLTGANKLVVLDAGGEVRVEDRSSAFFRSPIRLFGDAWQSAIAVIRSRKDLVRLERSVRDRKSETKSRRGRAQLEIAFLRSTPGPGTQVGGASTHINGFINAAIKSGVHIQVITNDRIAGLNNPAVPVTLVPMESVGIVRSAFDLRNNLVFTRGAVAEISRKPPDFIYQRYGRFTWAGVAASLITNRPLFLEYNGSEVWVGKYWDSAGMIPLLERVERLNLEAAARIFVVSEVERKNLLRSGVEDEKIVVNPNGVDTDTFRPDVGGEQIRAEFGIKDDEVMVGFVGSFGPWHGVLELAKAITLMPAESRTKFLLVGSGKLREETEEIIRAAGRSDRVIFTGNVAHEQVPALLDACDVLVSPHVPLEDGSDFFGSPTKLFEYMAMGKGLVASRLGQIGDVLTHEESALLVEPGNVTELSQQMLRMAHAPELRVRLGQRARQIVEEKFTWRHNAQRVLNAYEFWLNAT